MLWNISPDDANKNIVTIRDRQGVAVAAPVGMETALELVHEHNEAVYRIMVPCLDIAPPAAEIKK